METTPKQRALILFDFQMELLGRAVTLCNADYLQYNVEKHGLNTAIQMLNTEIKKAADQVGTTPSEITAI